MKEKRTLLLFQTKPASKLHEVATPKGLNLKGNGSPCTPLQDKEHHMAPKARYLEDSRRRF
jgi:hypothetical protein